MIASGSLIRLLLFEKVVQKVGGKDASGGHQLLLGTVEGLPFRVNAAAIVTGRTCVIGASGSGKSYAVAVILEELCKNKAPFAVVDTEGEYSGLKDRYEAILVSEDEGADLKWSELNIRELATQAPDIAPLILDTSDLENPRDAVQSLLSELYSILSERRTPYLVVIEEADRFVPQSGDRIPIVGEIARRGRKRGIGLMVCTQRPSLVDKNILSQCGNQLIGKLVIQNDLQSVSQFFSSKGVPKMLTTLNAGHFYAMGGLCDRPVLVKIRQRETRHGGFTPELRERVVKPFMGTLGASVKVQQPSPTVSRGEPPINAPSPNVKMGFNLIIPEEEVPSRVSRTKSHVIFGEQEKVTSLSLNWRALQLITVLQMKGVIRKGFKAHFLLLDCLTGSEVELGEGISFRPGVRALIGHAERDIRILRALKEESTMTVVDVEGRTGYPRSIIRRVLSKLEQEGIVSSTDMGRYRAYRRLVKIPSMKLLDEAPRAQPIVSDGGSGTTAVPSQGLDQKKVRELIRGLFDDSDATEFSLLFYPLWRVELARGPRRRVSWIDGRTGREVDVP